VFQRNGDKGVIKFKTKNPGNDASQIRIRAEGESSPCETSGDDGWFTQQIVNDSNVIEANVICDAGGWYKFSLEILNGQNSIIGKSSVETVGIGEIFIVAGGLNSTNCGDEKTKANSNLVVQTDGSTWSPAQDPMIGTQDSKSDTCKNGSPWPAAGDALIEAMSPKVPIAFAVSGHKDSTIEQWQKSASVFGELGESLFTYTSNLATRFGSDGFRAVLWQQGESDSKLTMARQDYSENLQNLVGDFRTKLSWESMPWLVAISSYCPSEDPYSAVRDAQSDVISGDENIIFGPDLDELKLDFRGNLECNFNAKGIAEAGKLWSTSIWNFISK
jgi:hypothetical protein